MHFVLSFQDGERQDFQADVDPFTRQNGFPLAVGDFSETRQCKVLNILERLLAESVGCATRGHAIENGLLGRILLANESFVNHQR